MDFLPSLPTLLAFTAATLLLAATPGPDMTLSISRALSQGKAAAFFVVVGTSLGCVVHTLLVAFGISALITASPAAFMTLKTGGAAYLFWLAVQAIRYGSTLTVNKVDDTGARRWPIYPQALGQSAQPESHHLLHDFPAAVRHRP